MWTSLLNFRKKRRGKKPKSADEDKSEPSDPVEMKRMTIQTPGTRNKKACLVVYWHASARVRRDRLAPIQM